ncbi:inositol monophosphatase family protein [Geodermatophilus obscurus]|uniref:Inositol monophosphatase n=1 Tax=Geodermatophilus obscurus (strain ATCC 25078 / DSM 43160 / JCM 3152 / CCUG 61914 / KCC A-0152 / KCTC 9177 / NBRC 13315 / NRRL B-3577 / G-20) TaxID=526225 RepID=D2S4Q8_GEOOG|nr:inositol monophosphatase family protein [Geodermatophilus obscurus]ADB77208.1 inositol monophosphatase [Geodermatophilus obscurus DSM 43160]
MSDVEVAAAAARAAAAVLTGLREEGRLTGRDLGDAGDAAAHAAISEVLAERRPGDVVFSEEAVDDRRRLTAERVWIVDPLDGTREYGEAPRPDWAVHVALWADGDLAAAAVALPALGAVLVTDPAPTVPAPAGGRPRIAVSRSRPPAVATTAAAALDAELVPMGSAGWKVTAVVRGKADAYVHAGGMYQWDSAAPVAVAWAAGLTAVRLDGSPLVYNGPDAWLPDLLVCRPELADRLLAAVRAGSQPPP